MFRPTLGRHTGLMLPDAARKRKSLVTSLQMEDLYIKLLSMSDGQ